MRLLQLASPMLMRLLGGCSVCMRQRGGSQYRGSRGCTDRGRNMPLVRLDKLFLPRGQACHLRRQDGRERLRHGNIMI